MPRSKPPYRLSERVRLLSWVLPLLLFVVVAGYETQEHIIRGHEPIGIDFYAEILVFGAAGGVLVGLTLAWIARNLVAQEQAENQIRQLNVELEDRVQSRTRSLSAANQRLSEVNAQLHTLDELKSDFVSLVSHELRTPLTSIGGGTELLLSAENIPEEHQSTLEVILSQSQRLHRLVETILDVSTIEAGHWPLNPGPIALPPLVDRVVNELAPLAGRRRITRQLETGLAFAWADEDSVAMIISNLLDNAIKYTPEGSKITIAGAESASTVKVSVNDNGPGIPQHAAGSLFEPFRRMNYLDDREVYGHGFGLYIARKLAELQGGRLEVSGNRGHGAQFTLALPLAKDDSR